MSLLNAKQAAKYLEIGLYAFNAEVLKGNIRIKPVGRRKMYRTEDLENWRNSTISLSVYTNAETSTTRTYRLSQVQENGCNLASLRTKYFPKKQRNIA